MRIRRTERRGARRWTRGIRAGIWLACAGCALVAGAKPSDDSAAGGWPENARGLLERPDFLRTDSGTNAVGYRAVAFCGHVHVHTNTWRCEALDADRMEIGRDMLGTALAKYPMALLSEHLEAVHLVRPGSLRQFRNGQWDPAAAGTYGETSLYVILETFPGRTGASRFSEAVFHHELSSILVGKHPELFNQNAWRAANPPRFKYANRMVGSPQLATNLFAEGFVASYGKSSLENDVNTYAMHLFTRADWLLRQAERHPRVRRKLDVLMDFYERLDPGFTRGFFRRHCRTSLSAAARAQLDDAAQAIAEDASNPKLRGERACLYNNLDLYPEAIEDAEAALRIDPRYGYGYYVRGWARARSDMREKAIEDFTRAVEFDPSLAAAYRERARAYRSLGRMDEAKRDREAAKALDAAGAERP